ncbi:hypothetical protein TNCV_926641 [Trichonephila clavipes]|nr:hypothetical protein TNCV_926641 [Trichonephila clavipes]
MVLTSTMGYLTYTEIWTSYLMYLSRMRLSLMRTISMCRQPKIHMQRDHVLINIDSIPDEVLVTQISETAALVRGIPDNFERVIQSLYRRCQACIGRTDSGSLHSRTRYPLRDQSHTINTTTNHRAPSHKRGREATESTRLHTTQHVTISCYQIGQAVIQPKEAEEIAS